MYNITVLSSVFRRYYEGEGTSGTGGTATLPPPPPPTGAGNLSLDDLKKHPEFQREINRINADEKRRNKELVDQLKTLRESSQLSEQEKADLTHRIGDLEATFQTKEEQARLALDNVKKELDAKVKTTETQRDDYRNRYERLLISGDVARAAQEFEAHRIEQIEALLAPITKVGEAIDPTTGKPTGEFVPQVDFVGRDKEGKEVKLPKISVREAVKLMAEMTDKYGNLFKNKSIDGINGNTNGQATGGGAIPDISKMSPDEYRKHRERIVAELRKR